MNVLVVGGCGFIGSHIVDSYIERGDDVRVLDRQLQWINKNATYVEGDIFCDKTLNGCIRGRDLVINAAGLSDLNIALDKPIETVRLNIESAVRIMQSSQKQGASMFGHCSSVYADSEYGGFYACSKRAAESYIMEYSKRFSFNCKIFRFGTVYGRRANSANGLFRIVENAVLNGNIAYSGDIDATREYINVNDAADLVVDICSRSDKDQVYIISGIEKTSVKDILNIIGETLSLDPNNFKIKKECYDGHYTYTPYSLRNREPIRKIIKSSYVEIGSGIYDLCLEITERIQERSRN